MQITDELLLELQGRPEEHILYAMQGDTAARKLRITLLEKGEPWPVPQGVSAALAFRKADRHQGIYDRLPDDSQAVTVEGSTVTVALAPQMLTFPGDVKAALVFRDENLEQLSSFPFILHVLSNPAAGQSISNDYYHYTTLAEVNEAVDAALASLEDSKQDFLAKAEEALQVVHGTATEDAPAIVCEVTGQTIAVADAADRPLAGLSICGKTTQNGTPAPSVPVPLESIGEAVGVTVGEQTITAATQGGLHSIGEIKDEVDFARGVLVRRVGRHTITADDVGTGIQDGVVAVNNPTDFLYQEGTPMLSNRFSNYMGYCDGLSVAVTVLNDGQFCNRYWPNSASRFHYFRNHSAFTSVDAAKAWFTANETVIYYPLAEPVETPLSAEELAAFAVLRSNKPNTTVFNDATAEMKLAYVADTKTYIDRKLAAISAAMLG